MLSLTCNPYTHTLDLSPTHALFEVRALPTLCGSFSNTLLKFVPQALLSMVPPKPNQELIPFLPLEICHSLMYCFHHMRKRQEGLLLSFPVASPCS